MGTSQNRVGEILDKLESLAAESESVSVGDTMDAFGTRTFGPAIIIPALLELTPVGAIPGVPTFLAAIIALFALQKMIGQEHLWIPGIIERRCVSADKLEKGARKLRPVARFMDRHFHRRFQRLTRAPFSRIAAGVIVLLCASVPFLEVVPFASSVPMLVIAAFGVAILARDGILLAIALAASATVAGLAGYDYWDGGLSDTEEADGLVKQEQIDEAQRAAQDTADTARRAAEESAGKAQRTAQEAADNAQRSAEEAGQEIERAAEDAGDSVSEAVGAD